MRFDEHEPVGPILSRRDQRRIIMMVCGLGLVLFGIKLSANPSFWKSLFPERFVEQPADEVPEFQLSSAGPIDETITRPLLPNEFRSQPDSRFVKAEASDFDRRNAIDDSFKEPVPKIDTTPHNRVSNFFPTEVLNSILDNRMGVRKSESDAYYLMLAAAARKKIPDNEIEKAATYPVLMSNSDYYRGAPIQLTGKLKGLVPFEAGENRFRISNLYDAWIFTRESGNRPYHVVCSGVNNLPLNDNFEKPPEVTVTGYFFKREGYSSKGGLSSAPLVLAGEIKPRPIAQVVAAEDGQIQHYLSWFAVAVAGVLMFTLWNFAVSDWNYRFSRASQSLAPPANADLVGIEAVDINDVLRNLAETQEYEEQQQLQQRGLR